MKMKLKKYIYLINDITNRLLRKERLKEEESSKKLYNAVIIIFIILLASLALNIYLFYAKN